MTLMCALSVLLSSFAFGFESNAAQQYVTHNSGYHETGWKRLPPVKVWLDGDYEIGTDNISYSHSVKDQYVFDVVVDIPMDSNLFGAQYNFPKGVKSILLNVDGGIKYTVDENKVNDEDGLNTSMINLISASAFIYGKEYKLSIPSTSSNYYSNIDVPIDYWVYVENVPSSGFLNAGTFALHLEFQLYVDMSVTGYESIVVTPMYNLYLDNGVTFVLFDDDVTMQDIENSLIQNGEKVDDLKDSLVVGDDSMNSFQDSSDGQSDKLNDLNEQNKMDKIDVDSASSSVDANIDGNAISNYGVVLSSITGSSKVVQMLLITLSVGLVSYVLFGKR